MIWCLSIRLSLNHTNTSGPIQMKFCTKLAVIHRSNIGLLSFRFFTPFHYGGHFHYAITAKS